MRSLPEGGDSTLLCFLPEKVTMIFKLDNEIHFDANNQSRDEIESTLLFLLLLQ